MIELTEKQRQVLEQAGEPARVVETNTDYLLVRKDVYKRMQELLYDDSPWTDEEMDLLAEEAGELLDRYQP